MASYPDSTTPYPTAALCAEDFELLASYHVAQAALAQKAAHKIAKNKIGACKSNAKLYIDYATRKEQIAFFEDNGIFENAFPFIRAFEEDDEEESLDKEAVEPASVYTQRDGKWLGKHKGLVWDRQTKTIKVAPKTRVDKSIRTPRKEQ